MVAPIANPQSPPDNRTAPRTLRRVLDVFPDGFFRRSDDTDDRYFYLPTRLVTHIDDEAIATVGKLYRELELGPSVLDLCASWVSHFIVAPAELTVLGMNATELAANRSATAQVVRDINAEPALPFPDASFDDVTCCVSVDYLTQPLTVFAEVSRVVRPGGRFVCTWSNRCFPTKVIHGWLATPELERPSIVSAYFAATEAWEPAVERTLISPGLGHDPLWAVWAVRSIGSDKPGI